MRWTKRLKLLRISKIVIPIALAVSLVFAGFSVFAKEAENFVLRINNDNEVNLALTLNRDLSEQTSYLRVPVGGSFEDVTYIPDTNLKYDSKQYMSNLPDDIALQDGVHNVYMHKNKLSFYSFSFYLVNNSARAVDVDMRFNIDSLVVADKNSDIHVDDAVRIMIIDGESLLSQGAYRIYKKAEKNEENQQHLNENVLYNNEDATDFLSDSCIFERKGELGYRNIGIGDTLRFTVVIWLEGWDEECIDEIMHDSLKMSIDFNGY